MPVHETTLTARIQTPTDVDQYAIELDPGQAIAVVVEPTDDLQVAVVLRAPTGEPAGAAVVGAPGEPGFLGLFTEGGRGTLIITVSGVAGAGYYDLRVILNAAVEAEMLGPAPNDVPGDAQSIEEGFVSLGGWTREAVVRGQIGALAANGFETGTLEPDQNSQRGLRPQPKRQGSICPADCTRAWPWLVSHCALAGPAVRRDQPARSCQRTSCAGNSRTLTFTHMFTLMFTYTFTCTYSATSSEAHPRAGSCNLDSPRRRPSLAPSIVDFRVPIDSGFRERERVRERVREGVRARNVYVNVYVNGYVNGYVNWYVGV